MLREYDYTADVKNITCPTLVIDGAAEMTPEAPKELYDALDCPKTHLFFDEGTCGQLHSQMGAPLTSEEYVFDWVADNF